MHNHVVVVLSWKVSRILAVMFHELHLIGTPSAHNKATFFQEFRSCRHRPSKQKTKLDMRHVNLAMRETGPSLF